MSETQSVAIGDAVDYVDQHGRAHNALVTAVWGPGDGSPSVNLVYVVDEEAQRDQYGRQLQRETSVVAESKQYAPGRYWRF